MLLHWPSLTQTTVVDDVAWVMLDANVTLGVSCVAVVLHAIALDALAGQ